MKYQVIAKMHKFKGEPVQPFFYHKAYKHLKSAQNFIEKNKNHSKFYFEIEEVAA